MTTVMMNNYKKDTPTKQMLIIVMASIYVQA